MPVWKTPGGYTASITFPSERDEYRVRAIEEDLKKIKVKLTYGEIFKEGEYRKLERFKTELARIKEGSFRYKPKLLQIKKQEHKVKRIQANIWPLLTEQVKILTRVDPEYAKAHFDYRPDWIPNDIWKKATKSIPKTPIKFISKSKQKAGISLRRLSYNGSPKKHKKRKKKVKL